MKTSLFAVFMMVVASAFAGALDGPNDGLQSGHVQGADDVTQGVQYRIEGRIMQVVDGGVLVECHLMHTSGNRKAIGTVFVKGYASARDGDKINVMGVDIGNYTYTDVMGSQRTVAAYALAN